MFDRQSEPLPSSRAPELYLDYGSDAQVCDEGGVEVSEQGMRFCSQWHFEVGAQILVACVHDQPRLGSKRVNVEGVVVSCEARDGKGYETALLFLELPDELRQGLREFSLQLAAEL